RRNAGIEAPDQFAAHGAEVSALIDSSAWDKAEHGDALGPIVGEAIFRFPEQRRQEAEAIFVAATDEPAGGGVLVNRLSRRSTTKKSQPDPVEPCLRIAA